MATRWGGRDIVSLRIQLGVTQAGLADRLGVDQATVSRWERGLRSPEPRARLQLEAMLRQRRLTGSLAMETALVEHSPFPMAIVSPSWHLIAHSKVLEPDGLRFERYPDQRLKTTADLEYAVSKLRESGFFDGKIGAARIVAHGFLAGDDPLPFAALCTPIMVGGEICRLDQYEMLNESAFAERRQHNGAMRIVAHA